MIENNPALYKFQLKKRPMMRWLLCSWKGHKFTHMVAMQNGMNIPVPLPGCERCGLINPAIIFPAIEQGPPADWDGVMAQLPDEPKPIKPIGTEMLELTEAERAKEKNHE